MTNDPEIQDIVNQLQQLQIQQSALIERLEQLNKGTNASENTASPRMVPARARREFAIGDRVTIRKPGRFQARKAQSQRSAGVASQYKLGMEAQ
jgi:hypothetical protein